MTKERHCKPKLRNYSEFPEGVIFEVTVFCFLSE